MALSIDVPLYSHVCWFITPIKLHNFGLLFRSNYIHILSPFYPHILVDEQFGYLDVHPS